MPFLNILLQFFLDESEAKKFAFFYLFNLQLFLFKIIFIIKYYERKKKKK